MTKVTHLYAHVPFCARRCDYCDFYSTAGSLTLAPAYVEAVIRELKEEDSLIGSLETVYLGGGTPTLLGEDLLLKLLAGLLEKSGSGAEVSAEANPATITPRLAARLAAAGVNRVSLGVQSFSVRLRANLGRAGDAAQVGAAMYALRAAGIDNLGLDLIFGIPGQSISDLESDVRRVMALEPKHVSCYELSVKDGTSFQRQWAAELEKQAVSAPRFYEMVVDTMVEAGYNWYETSNFSLPGWECRHNLACWGGADYVGLGAGAWSTVGLERWRNVEDIGFYIDGGYRQERHRETLTPAQKDAEWAMLGLRLKTGITLAGYKGPIDPLQLNLLQRNGFLKTGGGKIYLTRAGRFVANEVCARLLQDWEETAAGGRGAA